mmetsp:Transcript_120182/g.340237  ORF Transcript_120182/g.340237 Transcript_120182/m.340237 type:complete len:544 (+) Transcript_120182:55-1686(+)
MATSSDCVLESPALPMLLRLLPAKSLSLLVCCRRSLKKALASADEHWARCITEVFGGSAAQARRRLPDHSESSLRDLFIALSKLRMAVSRVEVIQGDLADAETFGVDAVVCPTVPNLGGYGPAARAVYGKAGDELSHYIAMGGFDDHPLQPGQVHRSPGFNLGVEHLVHAVGPMMTTPDGDAVLRSTYEAALDLAVAKGAKSMAFGSISTGGNGFSIRLGAQIAAEVFRDKLVRYLSDMTQLRLIVVAYEPHISSHFKEALAKMRNKVNENLVECLPVMVMDCMLPGQRLSIPAGHISTLPSDCDRLVMLGKSPNGFGIMHRGVEAKVSKPSSNEIEIVAGRRCLVPGKPQQRRGRIDDMAALFVSVEWMPDEERLCGFQLQSGVEVRVFGLTQSTNLNGQFGICGNFLAESHRWGVRLTNGNMKSIKPENLRTRSSELLQQSKDLEPLVIVWLSLVRGGFERKPKQMDMILDDLGPMPPAEEATARAIWVAALINPLPGLGVAYEIRPSMLMANTVQQRLEVATDGLQSSISHLDGSRPLGA